ncbi:28 kDa heat- and acid-stable phosphoprotein-like [Drosophila elegans]|uniref:28 kDa heat- and acid-stable phosphoprotein-like n=1 Tax=Drosophila elegans TaxID=30023 RepID=UPI0007E70F73|nr:28 kDa heat- and acid-stable phosphoprotein-like [Drosophila elegans]XP_017129843.1 28 kDa heat- and acid-stable phosphoprotein-like [Drosophila elegans]
MPRRKNMNHKGRNRQFTPVDELQLERNGISQDEVDPGQDQSGSQRKKNLNLDSGHAFDRIRGVHSLIEVYNPNRLPREKPLSLLTAMTTRDQHSQLDEANQWGRHERKRERIESKNMQRSREAKADLARLALVRQEREAAAERRLAAKKAAAKAATSSSESFLKKINPKPPLVTVDSPRKVLELNSPSGYQAKDRTGSKK